MEKSAALSFCVDAKNSAAFMKGGMTYVQFCGTAFCIIDFMGDFETPDRETERRTQTKQKEITFQNGADGNIGSYFFQHALDRNALYICTRRFFKMAYLVWILTGIAIALGFLLGIVLGKGFGLGRKAVGTIHVISIDNEAPEMFLTLDQNVSALVGREYAVLRIKTGKTRK